MMAMSTSDEINNSNEGTTKEYTMNTTAHTETSTKALVDTIVDLIAIDVENRHLPVELCQLAVDDILFAVNERLEGGPPLASIGC